MAQLPIQKHAKEALQCLLPFFAGGSAARDLAGTCFRLACPMISLPCSDSGPSASHTASHVVATRTGKVLLVAPLFAGDKPGQRGQAPPGPGSTPAQR